MRRVLLEQDWPEGWGTLSATFTIPGPCLGSTTCRDVWGWFCHKVQKAGPLAMIWRMEVQQRGALHWHCLVGAGPGAYTWPGRPRAWVPETSDEVIQAADFVLRRFWRDALDSLGPQEYSEPVAVKVRGRRVRYVSSIERLSEWPGAGRRSVDIEREDAYGAGPRWRAYLQDHATKAKQAQIAGAGRHWGIVGRRHLRTLPAARVLEIEPEDAARIRRAMARKCTPTAPDAGPFGRHLQRRIRRGQGAGRSDWFGGEACAVRYADYLRREREAGNSEEQKGGGA